MKVRWRKGLRYTKKRRVYETIPRQWFSFYLATRLRTKDADLLGLSPGIHGTKDPIPDPGLLTVVHARLTVQMVVGVVFDGQFHTERSEDLTENGVGPVGANTRVTKSLDVKSVANSEPHFDERHLGRDGGGEEGDDEDFDDFLVVVSQDGEDGGWVFGGVMLTVDEPEEVEFVAGAVVEVEPVVECDLPPADLKGCSPGEAGPDVGHVSPPG